MGEFPVGSNRENGSSVGAANGSRRNVKNIRTLCNSIAILQSGEWQGGSTEARLVLLDGPVNADVGTALQNT